MKTRTIILLSVLFASAASALTVFLPDLIGVTADNAREHRISVVISYETDDDAGQEVRSNQRYVTVNVPALRTKHRLREMSLHLNEQGRHSSVPLAFTEETTNAQAMIFMDIAHIRDSRVSAKYVNPEDKRDLGIVYSIELGTFILEKPALTAYERGLDYLASMQNTNGSWGAPSNNLYETCFAVLAFFHYGETPGSEKYGNIIEQGLMWLGAHTPTNVQEHVALYHTLSVAYYLIRAPNLREVVASHSMSINPDELHDDWALLFDLTKHLESEKLNRWEIRRALRGFSVNANGTSPLSLYLQTLAMFISRRDNWTEYKQNTLVPLVARQAPDGSFSLEQGKNQIESTAFALLLISVYHRYSLLDYLDLVP